MGEQLIYAFNKFFYELLSELKSISSKLSEDIRQGGYTVKDMKTQQNFEMVKACLGGIDFTCAHVSLQAALQQNDNEFLKGMSMRHTIEHVPEGSKQIFTSYVVLFHIMIMLSQMDDASLLEKALTVISNMQHGSDEGLDDILDDSVVAQLKLFQSMLPTPSSLPSFIANTKIGEITQEIVNELDLSKINLQKPEDILDFKNNNLLGDIVSKVGNAFQKKISSGEVKHDELFSEAMGMLGNLASSKDGKAIFDSPLFKEMMKSAGGAGKAVINKGKLDALSARERLKRKHQEKHGGCR